VGSGFAFAETGIKKMLLDVSAHWQDSSISHKSKTV
jgi:hypothetical protein